MSNSNHKIPSLIGVEEASESEAPFAPGGMIRTKSCGDCKNFRRHDIYAHCEEKMIPLTNSLLHDEQQLKSFELIASQCGEFSPADPAQRDRMSASHPVKLSHTVFFPIPAVQQIPNPRGPKSTPHSCHMCIFFVNRADYSSDTGMPYPESTGYCSRKGLLLSRGNHNLLIETARACDEGTTRGAPVSLSIIQSSARLIPEYNPDYLNQILEAERLEAEFKKNNSQAAAEAAEAARLRSNAPWDPGWEPTTHVSEFEVDEDSKAQGIRAWYAVRDPEGTGNEVIIPIFDREFFSPAEQAKIPSSADDERPQDYVDHQGLIYNILVAWMELDETPALIGPAGTGKTEVLRTLAWMMQLPFERISITGSTELDDLQGKMLFKDNETTFQYGRLSAAWTKPNVICLDEPNVGPPEVWQFIRPLTDNSKQLVVDANSGERLIRDNNCFPGLAMNPAWDTKNIGAEFISDADSSRLLHIETRLPNWEIESKIIKHRCQLDGFEIPEILLDVLRDVSTDLRAMSDNGEIPISWGIRSQIKVARLLKWFKVKQAYLQAGISSLEPSVREIVLDLIKTREGDLARRYAEQKAKAEREAKTSEMKKAALNGQHIGHVPASEASVSFKPATSPSPTPSPSPNAQINTWKGLNLGF